MRGAEQQQREKLLIALWVRQNYPRAEVFLNKQVGPIVLPRGYEPGDPLHMGLAKAHRRKVDALIIQDRFMILAEGKIDQSDHAIGQLLTYDLLVGKTPELAAYARYPRKLIIVAAVRDAIVESICRKVGIAYQVFEHPDMYDALHVNTSGRRRQFQQGLSQSDAALKAATGRGK